MREIHRFHDFISDLPENAREALLKGSHERSVAAGDAIYRQGDAPTEMYQIIEGVVKICNYSEDGKELITNEFRGGDCFGEMGLVDGLPRVSHAVAVRHSRLRVIGKQQFDRAYGEYPQISRALNLMLCRRVRLLISASEDASGLNLHQRLARVIHRLAYSHGFRDQHDALYIGTSHEELAKMLGASRQSVSKELKALEKEGSVELSYGKIYVRDLEALNRQYETLMGMEQITPVYDDGM